MRQQAPHTFPFLTWIISRSSSSFLLPTKPSPAGGPFPSQRLLTYPPKPQTALGFLAWNLTTTFTSPTTTDGTETVCGQARSVITPFCYLWSWVAGPRGNARMGQIWLAAGPYCNPHFPSPAVNRFSFHPLLITAERNDVFWSLRVRRDH